MKLCGSGGGKEIVVGWISAIVTHHHHLKDSLLGAIASYCEVMLVAQPDMN